jgi:hypothetical protein
MKTMIWKELRENARWAALAFFCLLLAETYALSSGRDHIGDLSTGLTLCSDSFLLVSAFGCAAIGAALGALQILPELRRDQWASLLHRPVPRHVIFLGKVVAGLLLYGLATGLPLLVSVIDVAWPGHFAAPFVPALARPAASDLFLGVVFYFAALLLSLHPGRWFGARGAIALGAVAVLVLHLQGDWPFVLPVLAAAAFFAAAWGAMLGPVALRSWMSRVALGAIMLTGVEAGLQIAGAVLRGGPQETTAIDYFFSNFRIATDGSVFLSKRDDQNHAVLTDMQGNVVSDPRYVSNEAENNFLYPCPFADRETARLRALFPRRSRSSFTYVEAVAGVSEGPEIWYKIAGERSYFVGYDRLSARRIGICDADGFKGAEAIPRPFANELQGESYESVPLLNWVGPQLYTFDFTERRMTAVFNAGSSTVYGASKYPATLREPSRIIIALPSEIRVLDMDGAPLFTLPYGHPLERWPNIGVTATQDFGRTFLQYSPSYFSLSKDADAVVHLDVMDAQGHFVATYAIPQTVRIIPPTWSTRIADLANMPVPSLGSTLWANPREPNFWSTIFHVPTDSKSVWLFELFTVAVFLGIAAVVQARKAGLSPANTGTWVALTLVFGVAGFLTYRLAADWPTRVRCPRCARPRPVRDSSCPHCHELWATPPASGSEIFEPAESPAS